MSTIIFLSPRIDNKTSFVHLTYFNLFHNLDIIPITLPFIHDKDKLESILKMGNGLILCGGIDINPSFFKQAYDKSEYIDDLDFFDFLLLDIATKLFLPVFGICRGLQVINVYFNGSLTEDIPNHNNLMHPIFFENQSNFVFAHFPFKIYVNSFHHQSILILGNDLVACAKSEDGTIEAIYSLKYPIYAIQWHSERLLDDYFQKKMMLNFFEICRNYHPII